MKRWLLRFTLLTAALAIASVAFAQVNLSWTDCGTNGAADATFACNTNSGVNVMIGSYISPNAPQCVANEFYLDFIEAAATIQPWWQVDATAFPGGCRTGGYTYSSDFTAGPFSCADFWGGQASGGGGILPNFLNVGPNTMRFKGVFAIAAEQPLTPDQETYSFKLTILHSKTAGATACAGCSDPACFVLNRITVNQPLGVGDFNLSLPAPGGRDFVTWQGGTGANCAAVPAQNRTWGQVKALYR